MNPAFLAAIAAVGQAMSAKSASDDANSNRNLTTSQWNQQFGENKKARVFNEQLQTEQMELARRQARQNNTSNQLGWLNQLQGLSRSSGQPTNLDVMGFLAGGR